MRFDPGLQLRLGGLRINSADLIAIRSDMLKRVTTDLPIHPNQKLLQRLITKLADRQAQGFGAGADGGISQAPFTVLREDFPDGLPVELRAASEVFLIP